MKKHPEEGKNFTKKQLEDIRNHRDQIEGLTWHHHQEPGKMQLVPSDIHGPTKHTGGRAIWGGGGKYR